MKVLITGAAGFIGNALALRLLARGDEVIGIDNLNDYYDPNLKKARLLRTGEYKGFTDIRLNLEDRQAPLDPPVGHERQGASHKPGLRGSTPPAQGSAGFSNTIKC